MWIGAEFDKITEMGIRRGMRSPATPDVAIQFHFVVAALKTQFVGVGK